MARVVLSGMALIAATYGLARFGYGLFLPRLEEEFALGPTVSGVVQAGSFLSYSVSALVAARLGGQPRKVVTLAGVLASAGSLGIAFAPGAAVLALSVVIAGAGAGFATPGLVSFVERNVARERQETAQTVVNAGTGAGLVVAGALAIVVDGQWRLGWGVMAVVAALTTVASLRSDQEAGTSRAGRPTLGRAELARLARPLVAAGLAGVSSAAVWTFGRSVMAESGPDADGASIVAWMVLGGFGVLGAVAGPLVQAWSLRTAWILTSGAMAISTATIGLVPGGVPAFAAVAVFGASYTALSGVLIVWAVRALPDASAGGTVALFVALAVGQAVGSVAVGGILGATSTAVAFVVAGAVGAVAAAAATRHVARSGATTAP